MLLTSGQASLALTSGIVFLFTSALFLSGYLLQQTTVQDLQTAIQTRLHKNHYHRTPASMPKIKPMVFGHPPGSRGHDDFEAMLMARNEDEDEDEERRRAATTCGSSEQSQDNVPGNGDEDEETSLPAILGRDVGRGSGLSMEGRVECDTKEEDEVEQELDDGVDVGVIAVPWGNEHG